MMDTKSPLARVSFFCTTNVDLWLAGIKPMAHAEMEALIAARTVNRWRRCSRLNLGSLRAMLTPALSTAGRIARALRSPDADFSHNLIGSFLTRLPVAA